MKELNEMFDKQKEFQRKLNNDMFSQEFRTIMSLALIDEVTESLRETPWKPWKKNQTFNRINYQQEIIDCWHFLINLTISSGMNPEMLHKMFMSKNKINNNRQEEGY